MPPPSDITDLLVSWQDGDQAALERLVPLVEKELHRLAHAYMRRENHDHTLQTTALINETFLQLVDQSRVRWQNRAHFYGIAAQLMRRILLSHARHKHREKRGGGAYKVSLSEVDMMSEERSAELLALDEALQRLSGIDARKGRVVELKYFGGLSVKEIAEVLDVSPVTVARDWEMARVWLARELSHES